MRWLTSALAGAVIGIAASSAISMGAAAGFVFYDLTGLKGLSVAVGFGVAGAGFGLIAEWCTA